MNAEMGLELPKRDSVLNIQANPGISSGMKLGGQDVPKRL